MSINSTIRAAVTPIVAVCVPDVYTGTATEYCTFNYTRYPAGFRDNKASLMGYAVQIHYFAPLGAKVLSTVSQLSAAIENADMTYPEVANASDKDGQHYVLQSDYFEEI